MGWTRASETDRTLNCYGPLILPKDDDVSSEGALWGDMAHHWKETGKVVLQSERFPQHVQLFQRKLDRVRPERLRLWPESGDHEIGVAINCREKGVEWVKGLREDDLARWKAQWPHHYLTGALDYLGWILDDPWVDDLKTGKGPWEDPREKPPRKRSQVWTYALAAYLITKAPLIRVSITWWPRYPVASEPLPFFQQITATELEAWWRRLNQKYTGLVQLQKRPDDLEVNPGTWCDFCRSDAYCPRERD